MSDKKHDYIIVTEDNYWAASYHDVTMEEVKEELKVLRNEGNLDPNSKCFVYQVKSITNPEHTSL